jgi:CheY-like chemotaxis protein/two-component sensor histidine kinase
MSHELRTPLNAILGFSQVLELGKLTSHQSESVQHILKGGRHLLGLINEVLDIARVESGHEDFSLEPVSLADVVAESCALMHPLATQHNVHLGENLSLLRDVHLLADAQRLKQVLINLLGNSIKYNRPGGRVDISCYPGPGGLFHIAVCDTGSGISPEGLQRLFTPFERLGATNSDIEGTGLGLVLSQRLVEAMGGTLEVESTLGRGSIFTLGFPQVAAPIEVLSGLKKLGQYTGTLAPAEGSYTVLCIEDNLSNMQLLEAIFEKRPEIKLLAAMQGSIGLDLARQHAPDLILLDLNLPDIQGQEVLAALQQSARTKDIPVIIISADATPRQIERLLSEGAKAYVTKPLDVSQFLATFDEWIGVRQETKYRMNGLVN